jgi:hypothetical protein
MNYLEAVGFGLGGRPGRGTSRIASRADSAYMPVGPAYAMGTIPARCKRLLTASVFMFNLAAISAIVNPFIILIIGIIARKSNTVPVSGQLLNKCLYKKSDIFQKYSSNSGTDIDILFQIWNNYINRMSNHPAAAPVLPKSVQGGFS